MNAALQLNRNNGIAWFSKDRTWVKGHLFDSSDRFHEKGSLPDYFLNTRDFNSFHQKLKGANGSFSVVIETDEFLMAAVDPLRSIPLFYTLLENEILISDDVEVLSQRGGVQKFDMVSHEEFLRIGFTLGPNTLYEGIKQIEAGEFIFYDKVQRKLDSKIYFSHSHGSYVNGSTDGLYDELDDVYSGVFSRLVTSAQGRTLAVPLSGGYDSRSILCGLKKAGYSNVLCYTYGAPHSHEILTAQKVAQTLGYPIHVISYDRSRWRSAVGTAEFSTFCRFVSLGSSVPHLQELPALLELRRNGVIKSDAIIVPGYAADLLGGSKIPDAFSKGEPGPLLEKGLPEHLWDSYFFLSPNPVGPEMKTRILDRIRDFTSNFDTGDAENFSSVYEDWFTREKVAKFIVNSVRTHEWYGWEWRLPLLDAHFLRWWYRIPLRLRIGSIFYHQYLQERIFGPLNVGFNKSSMETNTNPQTDQTTSSKNSIFALTCDATKTLVPTRFFPFVRRLKKLFDSKLDVNDINAFSEVADILKGSMPNLTKEQFLYVNGALAAWHLEMFKNNA